MIRCLSCGNYMLECVGELKLQRVTLQKAKYHQCIECGEQLLPEETCREAEATENLLDVEYGIEYNSKNLMNGV